MNNTENQTGMMLNPTECSRILFWALFSKSINQAVKVDGPGIERIISICSSNPLLEEEMIILQLILKVSKQLTDQTATYVSTEVHHEC